ncbi:GUN4 domain-containing protein [Dapis sp. BLCC M172]|uniref:GUN4 domain-containing protein n=1 Tax=Dapis sp. BLCC M172 TaxID=2975281 RepID=UPI003CF6E731
MAWLPGKKLYGDRYIIQKELGKGGYSITYIAKTNKGELVVIKTLKDEIFKDKNLTNFLEKYQQDFRDEALRLALCQHPNIVQIKNVFTEGKHPCIVMEYVAGENLEKLVKQKGKLSEDEALIYIQQIGEALTVIHAKGLLHRDVKPQNIIVRNINNNSQAVLIDFGIAREFIPDVTLTQTIAGSNGFSPIEQYAEKAKRGEFTDIYSLAATLYYLVTAEVPIPAPARAARIALNPPQQFNPKISHRFQEIIFQGMAFHPEDRPQSVAKWLSYFKEVKSQKSTSPLAQEEEVQSRILFSENSDNKIILENYFTSESLVSSFNQTEIDYRQLENFLAAQKWQKADAETREIMMKILGRETREWGAKAEIEKFPCTDLSIIDKLWIKYSNGRFGFSVQKVIWQNIGGKPDADYKIYMKFVEQVGWRVNENYLSWFDLNFNINAPVGHLPCGVGRGMVNFGIAFLSRIQTCGLEEPKNISPNITGKTEIDYSPLRDFLEAGNFREADKETVTLMLQVVGKNKDEKLTLFDIENFPCSELEKINQLWLDYSQSRFGFSVQKSIYFNVVKSIEKRFGKNRKYYKMIWQNFSEALGWQVEGQAKYYSELNFSLNAPIGHLPVSWCVKFKVEKFGVGIWRETFFNRVNNCLLHSEKFHLEQIKKNSIKNRIKIIQGDIAKQEVDAIVNSTDRALSAGSMVSNSIHKIAGVELKEACRKLITCEYGEAKITSGYNLSAKWVIHTVPARWQSGNLEDKNILIRCYRNSLALAEKYAIKTIAFPTIATGALHFPVEVAARIAITEVMKIFLESQSIEKVIIVCFKIEVYEKYLEVFREIFE